ncbi:MAG: AAA family ATPase [Myxococcales bacterium]|nr:AAA family ATPase [Myxococcales bacterium]
MAKSSQILALLRSYAEADEPRFLRTAMQLAAHEARQGHSKLAEDIRKLVDEAKTRRGVLERRGNAIPLARPTGELADLLRVSYPETRLGDMVLPHQVRATLERLLREHRQQARLAEHGLSARRHLLLVGPPGTGKTLTASAVAGELKLPLFVVRMEGLLTRYLGESASKLRLVFEAMERNRGVYLFDEFDAIGADRGAGNDVAEVRRVLNAFLQFIEEDRSESICIAATNHFASLDSALMRRFDDIIRYELPDREQVEQLLLTRLESFDPSQLNLTTIAKTAEGLSYAEIVRACEDAAKDMVLEGRERLGMDDVTRALEARRHGRLAT